MEAATTELLRKQRRSSKARALAMAAGALVILLFSVLIAVSAQAEVTSPTVVPVYGDGGKTPSAYVITDKDGTMFFCSITAGAQVYTCQQLHKGGN